MYFSIDYYGSSMRDVIHFEVKRLYFALIAACVRSHNNLTYHSDDHLKNVYEISIANSHGTNIARLSK